DAHGPRPEATQDIVLADTRGEVRGDGLRLRLRRDFLGIRAQASEFNGGPLALEARAPGGSRMSRTPGAPADARRGTYLLLFHFLVGLAIVDGTARSADEPPDEGALLAAHQRSDPGASDGRPADDHRAVLLGPRVNVVAGTGGGASAVDDALPYGGGGHGNGGGGSGGHGIEISARYGGGRRDGSGL